MAASSLCVMASSLSLKFYSPPALVHGGSSAVDSSGSNNGGDDEGSKGVTNEGTGLLAAQRSRSAE